MISSKSEITSTAPAHHGAFDYDELARLQLSPDEITDFSVNSNPYGPPPGVREAISTVPLERYPDRECLALRQKLAQHHGVEMANIVVGNGTAELFLLIAFAFLERGADVVVPEATFSEYERVARLIGANVRPLRRPLQSDHPFEMSGAVLDGARMVFLCNPNNPDGAFISPDWIVEQARRYSQTLFVIDEAYANFLETPQTVIPAGCPNVLAIRSLTKDYALAGLRLGYAVGQADLIEAIRRVRPAWNVNAPAQAAGTAALESGLWLHETVAHLHADKHRLVTGLRALGLSPLPSAVHYFLVDVGDGAAFRQKLLAHRLMVRDCASFGLPAFVRISTRTPQDNARLLDAVAKVLRDG